MKTIIPFVLIACLVAACADDGSPMVGGNDAATPGAVITTTSLPQGTVGQAYSATINAVGGANYSWMLTAGVLPTGLTLAASGTPATTISGTPTVDGTFPITVQVTDSKGRTHSVPLQLIVQPVAALTITSGAAMPDGTVGQAYTEPITATGGTGAYSWAVIDGEVPPGLATGTSGTPSTSVTGTPTAFGCFYFTVEVTDSASATATLDVTLIVIVAGTSDSWPATFSLAPDRGDAAVFTGSRILQFGGEFAADNGGEVLFPGLGTVTAMTTTNAPSARVRHAAVWTGRRMIVFGGDDNTNYFNTGGSYDPITDTWTAISTTGAPSARANHTAVWTGSEMIVWGGHDSAFNMLDDGGAYDPDSDTWRTLAAVPGSVAARDYHKAVWTGTHMIVWGGFDDSSTELYDGAIYDPSADTWSTVTSTGAPTVQAHQSVVVWTGTRLFVWGDRLTPVMDGAEWNPANDTWSGIGTWSVFRRYPGGVATPDGVFVWGGLDHYGTFAQNDGEFFDHTAQNWFTVASSPLGGRSHIETFWTGRQIIVWGGKDFGFAGANPQSDGAVYTR